MWKILQRKSTFKLYQAEKKFHRTSWNCPRYWPNHQQSWHNTIYVPILKTITRVLQHKDVLSHCLNSGVSRNDGRIGTYENFKQNKLFNSPKNSIEIILYHDDFNVVNPLGNKVSKYKVSAFYFVIDNVPNQFRSRLKDINLLLLSPASYITKYGYKEILQPCLDNLKMAFQLNLKIIYSKVPFQR